MRPLRRVAAAALLALLVACSPAPPAPAPSPPVAEDDEPTEVVVAVDGIGAGFNPHLLAHTSTVTTALATLVLPSVFQPVGDGTLQLDRAVATSAEVVSQDPFTVSYELNLEASWSTNAPIAAEDFVYLWERMRGEPGVTRAAGYQVITDIRSRAGGKAVDVVFDEPYPAWRELFANLLPAHLLKDAPGSWTAALANGLPASGGPFRIGAVDRARGEVVLARNDVYWDTPTVLDQLVLRRLDAAATAAGLRSGDVDIALPAADPAVRAALSGVAPAPRVQQAPRPTVLELVLRADSGPLAPLRVRQGIAAIVDRGAVRAAVAPDALPADAFGPAPSEPGYAPTVPETVRPDPEAAQERLTAAGWTREPDGRWASEGEPVRLVVGAAAERPDDVRVAELVAEQLDAAGIDTTVAAPPATALFGQGRPPADAVESTATPTPIPAATSTPPPSARTGPDDGEPVTVDITVTPRAAGGAVGVTLASRYACPEPEPETPAPPASSFCLPVLDLVLDRLVTDDDAQRRATAENLLWQWLPALPLYQPVTLVVSTPAADTATGVRPGPFRSGPLTGAQEWSEPAG